MVFQIEHYDLINLYFANVLNIICGTRPHIIQCRIYIQSCVKTLLLSYKIHLQKVSLTTQTMHYCAIFQLPIPTKPGRNVFTLLCKLGDT